MECFRHLIHPAIGIITKIFTLQRGRGMPCNAYSCKGKYACWPVNSPASQNLSCSFQTTLSQNKGHQSWFILFLIQNNNQKYLDKAYSSTLIHLFYQILETQLSFALKDIFLISFKQRLIQRKKKKRSPCHVVSHHHLMKICVCVTLPWGT